MITMSKNDYEIILKHARENLPEEACGLIAGTKDGNDKSIQKVYCLTNIDHSNEHFSLDPKEQLAAVKDMRANGLVPLETGILIRKALPDHPKKTRDWLMTAQQAI